jgi:hypothetical protein
VPAMKYVMDCNIGGEVMTITSNTLVACVGAVCDASLYADYAGHVANVNDNPEAEELWSSAMGGDCTFSEIMTSTSSTGGDTTTESADSNGDATTTTTTSSFYSWSTSSSEQAVTPSPSVLTEVEDTNAGLSDECMTANEDLALDPFFSAAMEDALSNCPDAVSMTLDSLTMDYSVCSSSVLDDIEEACIAAGGKA